MAWFFGIAIYLMPILCIIFILNSIALAKKIKRDEVNTAKNTFWTTASFTLIIYTFVWIIVQNY